jgi:hypothetical protein
MLNISLKDRIFFVFDEIIYGYGLKNILPQNVVAHFIANA